MVNLSKPVTNHFLFTNLYIICINKEDRILMIIYTCIANYIQANPCLQSHITYAILYRK